MTSKPVFKNKSATLLFLQDKLKKSVVLPQCSFTVSEFLSGNPAIKESIRSFCKGKECIVRSSSLTEDSSETSKAGMYLSVPNVTLDNVDEAILEVIDSYGEASDKDVVFIQPMLKNPQLCGVAFTIDPNTCGNYYVLNYDESGSTDSVTSGESNSLKTYYLFKGAKCSEPILGKVIEALTEIEPYYPGCPLDIEFAFKDSVVYIFQVRPLVGKEYLESYDKESDLLEMCNKKLKTTLGPLPNICGKSTILSVMTDWNPAEMIGIRPRRLALSLYKRLITDREWAYQRHNYGYRDMRSHPLMIDFHGFPYIDTRISFNSFIPASLSENVASKLVDYYLDQLKRSPEKHDKVEFEIIYSCYTFNLPEKIAGLKNYGFSKAEIDELKNSLLSLTNNIIGIKDGMWVQDLQKIRILEEKREKIMSSDMDVISKIYWLLEDCGRYGTLPFAGLARAGFVAVQLLKSLVEIGILSQDDYQRYMNNLNTVSSQMSRDRAMYSNEVFIKKYGHLRPGTYDITIDRYDSNPEKYFSKLQDTSVSDKERVPFGLTLEQYGAIADQLKAHGFEVDVLQLFEFIKNGIEGREFSKFVFTKNVSDVLELLASLGKEHGFSREDMSYLDISVINDLYCSVFDMREVFSDSIRKGMESYSDTEHLCLPPVIIDSSDVFDFFIPNSVPNYITLKTVTGELVSDNLSKDNVSGKILLIEAADPGYDWIFSYPIAGFITKYGGANSHMAIRAGELGIPAVIGVGEMTYSELVNARFISIDCSNHKMEAIR